MYKTITVETDKSRYQHFTTVALIPGLLAGRVHNLVDAIHFTSVINIVPENWTCYILMSPSSTDGIEALLRVHGRWIKGLVIRSEPAMLYHVTEQPLTKALKEICNRYKVALSCIIEWNSPHVYVPRPRYLPGITNTFQHVLLSSDQPDAYHCVDYMVEYLLQSGANSRQIYPMFLYYAQLPLKRHNLGGYFIGEKSIKVEDIEPRPVYPLMLHNDPRRFPSPQGTDRGNK